MSIYSTLLIFVCDESLLRGLMNFDLNSV